MDKSKSYEFIFLHLINKCILLFKYIDNQYQKQILYDIKLFINKLQDIFSTSDFENNTEKKNKILELLIEYFEKIIETKIYKLITSSDKENIIKEIDKKALNICEKNNFKKNINSDSLNSKTILESLINTKENINNENNENNENNLIYSEKKDLLDFEIKINNKIKNIFNEIENNIKKSLKEYFLHTQYVEYDLDKKFNEKIEYNNIYIENKIKDYFNNNIIDNTKLYNYISDLIKDQVKDIYLYTENIITNKAPKNIDEIIDNKVIESEKKINYKIENSQIDIKKNIINEIEHKIVLLGNIFNENIREIFNNLNTKILDNEKDLTKIINESLMNSKFNKNNFNIIFDKENNEIQLYYYNELISSTKISIKGLIGPKGPQGNRGEPGYTPIIRRVQFTDNNKIKFIIQENNEIYEIISDNNLPPGPQGIPGERGPPGKTYLDLKWNQENVMRLDEECKDSIIFMKSLCVGDKSHCLKDNSLAISGATCYNNNSFAIGSNSKTLDSESIAFYGSCVGKKSFSYRADNVDENMVNFGKKEKNLYNINSFDIISKEINIDCDTFRIKTNKYENIKIKELEDKIITLEKKIIEISKKI
jgi:hypothetical protein